MPHNPRRSNSDQVRSLASPTRLSILETLHREGRATAEELATTLARSRASILFHLSELQRVGLVTVVDLRPGVSRPSKVFAAIEARFQVQRGESTEAKLSVKKAGSAILRLAKREHDEAIDAGEAKLRVVRGTYRLNPADRDALISLLEAATEFARSKNDPSNTNRFSLTALLLPLND